MLHLMDILCIIRVVPTNYLSENLVKKVKKEARKIIRTSNTSLRWMSTMKSMTKKMIKNIPILELTLIVKIPIIKGMGCTHRGNQLKPWWIYKTRMKKKAILILIHILTHMSRQVIVNRMIESMKPQWKSRKIHLRNHFQELKKNWVSILQIKIRNPWKA